MPKGTDGMLLLCVPAGEFIMGSDGGNAYEKPARKSIWMISGSTRLKLPFECMPNVLMRGAAMNPLGGTHITNLSIMVMVILIIIP